MTTLVLMELLALLIDAIVLPVALTNLLTTGVMMVLNALANTATLPMVVFTTILDAHGTTSQKTTLSASTVCLLVLESTNCSTLMELEPCNYKPDSLLTSKTTELYSYKLTF